jgi:peptidoglycan/LPS O-acetylase OafA/YrhL
MTKLHISGGVLYALGAVGLIVGAFVIAWLMWKFVEEPAREWMRRRSGETSKPIEEAALAS